MVRTRAFTLLEILVVLTIVAILMAIGVMVFKGAQEKSKRLRASAEIAAIRAAINDFETDNSFIPPAFYIEGESTENEDVEYDVNPEENEQYLKSARVLFLALFGRTTFEFQEGNQMKGAEEYLFQKNVAIGNPEESGPDALDASNPAIYSESYEGPDDDGDAVEPFTAGSYLQDPFGNPYGYFYDDDGTKVRFEGANPSDKSLHNRVTYDLWSTCGQTTDEPGALERWETNWRRK